MSKQSRYILAMAALLCGAHVHAQTRFPPALAAEFQVTYTLPNGDELTKRGNIYRSANGKVRQDSGNGAMIADLQAGTVTLLVDERNEARVFTIPQELRQPPVLGADSRVPPTVEPFEETTIDGRRIAKTLTIGTQGERQEVWTAPDLGIVTFARYEANGARTTQELRNLSEGEPDPQVFEVPNGYTVILEPTRFENLSSRVPTSTDLHFGEGTRIVAPPRPTDDD
jgi:hypothetical protein